MSDMIGAVSTALAPSGIGVIRLSGAGCAEAADRILSPVQGTPLSRAEPRKLRLYDLRDRKGRVMDRILAVRTPGPNSYTGEDTVELQCHGSPAVLAEALANLFAQGVRQALPGEFTKRAFLNGRMDLTAAEAVIDLIEAETADAAANAAGQLGGALLRRLEPVYNALVGLMSHFHAVLDYPDEDIDDFSLGEYRSLLEAQRDTLAALLATADRGRVVKHGVRAVILGRPNAGKSSLLNALAGYDRVIVTGHHPGHGGGIRPDGKHSSAADGYRRYPGDCRSGGKAGSGPVPGGGQRSGPGASGHRRVNAFDGGGPAGHGGGEKRQTVCLRPEQDGPGAGDLPRGSGF